MLTAIFVALAIVAPAILFSRLSTNDGDLVAFDASSSDNLAAGARLESTTSETRTS
jgi:hypothetical protein